MGAAVYSVSEDEFLLVRRLLTTQVTRSRVGDAGTHVRVGTSMGVDALGGLQCLKGEDGASVLAWEEMVSVLCRACSRELMLLEQRCTLDGAVQQLDELERESAWERRLGLGVRGEREREPRSTGRGSSTQATPSSAVRSNTLQIREGCESSASMVVHRCDVDVGCSGCLG